MLDVARIRKDVPILSRNFERDGKKVPLVYFDNAATTQKPQQVIRAICEYYETCNSNVHRSIHELGELATIRYEQARAKIRKFLNAPANENIIFTKGATDSINLVARAWGGNNLKKGDRVLLSEAEHHSNLVPWQMIARETGAVLDFIPVGNDGALDISRIDALLASGESGQQFDTTAGSAVTGAGATAGRSTADTPTASRGPVKLVSVTHMSNVTGVISPLAEIIRKAKTAGARVCVDAAQSVAHIPVDVKALGADFVAFSGHKVFGPTGIGALCASAGALEEMSPCTGGGNMIRSVSLDGFEPNELPYRFEAGTPNIAGAIGLGAALDWMEQHGRENIATAGKQLGAKLMAGLMEIPDLKFLGKAQPRGPIASFTIENVHPHDITHILSNYGVAVRAGHHCAHPLMKRFGLTATIRASLAVYNTEEEIRVLLDALKKAIRFFVHEK